MKAAQKLMDYKVDLSKVTFRAIPVNTERYVEGEDTKETGSYYGGVLNSKKHGFGIESVNKFYRDNWEDYEYNQNISSWEVWDNGRRVWSDEFYRR